MCVCARARASVYACACACVWVRAFAWSCAHSSIQGGERSKGRRAAADPQAMFSLLLSSSLPKLLLEDLEHCEVGAGEGAEVEGIEVGEESAFYNF